MNHLHRFRLMHRPSTLAELCWGQVARLLRPFFSPELSILHLPQVLRSASATLLGLPPTTSNFGASSAAPGLITVTGDTASGSVQSLFAYTKSIFSYLLSHLRCEFYFFGLCASMCSEIFSRVDRPRGPDPCVIRSFISLRSNALSLISQTDLTATFVASSFFAFRRAGIAIEEDVK